MDIPKIIQKIKIYYSDLEKIDKLIILLLLISFLTRIAFLFYPSLRGWDETVYLNLGYDLSNNPLVYSLINSGWNDFIPSTDIIYGWPNIGFRAPLLPYIISIFYYIGLDFLIELIIPIFATLSIFLVYVLGKKLFNKRVGFYSAVLFSLTPIHLYCSGKIWTDTLVVFFILLTFISFWEGYEKGNKKHKILFGLFFALSLLARYTTLWIGPIFLLYFIIRDKSLRFMSDKYLWYAIGIFFLTLIPLFIYSFIYYDNILGVFLHGFKASSYWGGVQSWNFFFVNSWQIFSIIGIVFVFSIFSIFSKKEFLKREIYLLLIWLLFFSIMVMSMPHKEERFILPIIPSLCIISGFFINRIKKYKNIIFSLICIILIISLGSFLKKEYAMSQNKINICFSMGNEFLASDSVDKNSLIITNQSPIVYYYTKKDNLLYPISWSIESFEEKMDSIYPNKEIYLFFSIYDMDTESNIKKDLDNNYEKVFECSKDWGYSVVYKYK